MAESEIGCSAPPQASSWSSECQETLWPGWKADRPPRRRRGSEPGRSPVERFPVTVIGRYADTQLLQSGWIRGEELIRDKPALAEIDYGNGSLILLGFGVQRRAQPHGTFRLLFNAMQSATLAEAPAPAE